jgi:hypothetical protein
MNPDPQTQPVGRYDLLGDYEQWIGSRADGDYVLYEDYEKLIDRLSKALAEMKDDRSRCETALAVMEQENQALKARVGECTKEHVPGLFYSTALVERNEAREERDQLRAALEEVPGLIDALSSTDGNSWPENIIDRCDKMRSTIQKALAGSMGAGECNHAPG